MKRIINGKLYDTDTATLMVTWSNDLRRSDHGHVTEHLYHTPRGNWFLHGKGGPATDWAETVNGNGRIAASGLRALTPAEVIDWAERLTSAAEIFAIHAHLPDIEDA